MPRPFSLDLRQRIVAAVHAGESRTRVAEKYDVCTKTVANYLAREKEGTLEPRRQKPRPPEKLTPDALKAMFGWLQEKNDLTLKQLQQRLKEDFAISVTLPAIWKHLVAAKLTWKKNDPRDRAGTPRRPGATQTMAGASRRRSGGKADLH